MTWTKEPPREAGHYWIRNVSVLEIVRISCSEDPRIYGESFFGLEVDEVEEYMGIEWWPIRIEEPPDTDESRKVMQ